MWEFYNMTKSVIHDINNHQFKIESENGCAYLAYTQVDTKVMDIYSTYVPEALRGKNIAADLAAAAVDFAKQNNLTIIPTCSYVERYMQRNDLMALVKEV